MALTRCSMQSCGTLLSSAGKTRTSLITGFNKHESRLLSAVLLTGRCPPGAVCVGAGVWMSSVSRRSRLAVSCVPGLVTAARQGLGPAPASPLELGSVSCASWAELCLWQLTALLLWYKIMYFMGLGRQLCASPDVFCGILFPSTALILN